MFCFIYCNLQSKLQIKTNDVVVNDRIVSSLVLQVVRISYKYKAAENRNTQVL